MLRVGLTGGAGSGKSMVAAMLQELGAFVSQSDEIGRAMMQPGQKVYRQIVEHFGPGVLRDEGHLDRSMLARIAFQDGRVDELNRIVHPVVIAVQQDWMEAIAAQSPCAVAVVESALLFETRYGSMAGSESEAGHASWRNRFDRIVLVTAPEATRIQRYVARKIASEREKPPSPQRLQQIQQDARARMAAQMNDREKEAMSDFVLRNEGTAVELRAKVNVLYAALHSEAKQSCSAVQKPVPAFASKEAEIN